MGSEFEVIAFHGTTEVNSEKILQNQFKIKLYNHVIAPQKQNMPGDLGSGAYFYIDYENEENGLENAFKFTRKFKGNNVVIRTGIKAKEDNVLNMNDSQNIKSIQDFRNSKDFQSVETIFNYAIGSKKREIFDGIIIEKIIQKLGQEIHIVIKDTFTPFYSKNEISHYPNGTEICVRNKKVIKEKEIIKPELQRR